MLQTSVRYQQTTVMTLYIFRSIKTCCNSNLYSPNNVIDFSPFCCIDLHFVDCCHLSWRGNASCTSRFTQKSELIEKVGRTRYTSTGGTIFCHRFGHHRYALSSNQTLMFTSVQSPHNQVYLIGQVLHRASNIWLTRIMYINVIF